MQDESPKIKRKPGPKPKGPKPTNEMSRSEKKLPRSAEDPSHGFGLTEKQQKFVEEYTRTGNGRLSAEKAGYSIKNAAHAAYELLNETPKVRAAIEGARKAFQVRASYGLEQAMAECDDAIEFAKLSPNGASAFVKAIELKSKLNGLIVEKHNVQSQTNFQLKIVRPGGDGAPPALMPAVQILPALTPPGSNLPQNQDIIADTQYEIPDLRK